MKMSPIVTEKVVNKVIMRTKYKRSDMSMLEITPDFIKKFAAYLSTEAGLHNGTIWEKCMWLKGVVMRAHYNGLIPRNPFAQFHISPNVKEREYWFKEQFERLRENIGWKPVQKTNRGFKL